ncbi:hypothetical protein BpHYR1_012459, partial [Brachionus plicatilis]
MVQYHYGWRFLIVPDNDKFDFRRLVYSFSEPISINNYKLLFCATDSFSFSNLAISVSMCSGYWWSTEFSLYPLKCLLLPERSPSSKWISVMPRSWTWRPMRFDKVDAVSNSLLFGVQKICFVYLTLQVVVVVTLLVVVQVVLAVVVLVGVESQIMNPFDFSKLSRHSRGCGYALQHMMCFGGPSINFKPD